MYEIVDTKYHQSSSSLTDKDLAKEGKIIIPTDFDEELDDDFDEYNRISGDYLINQLLSELYFRLLCMIYKKEFINKTLSELFLKSSYDKLEIFFKIIQIVPEIDAQDYYIKLETILKNIMFLNLEKELKKPTYNENFILVNDLRLMDNYLWTVVTGHDYEFPVTYKALEEEEFWKKFKKKYIKIKEKKDFKICAKKLRGSYDKLSELLDVFLPTNSGTIPTQLTQGLNGSLTVQNGKVIIGLASGQNWQELIDKYTKQDCSSTPPDSFACIIKDIKNEIIDVSNSIRNTDYEKLEKNKNYIKEGINNFYTKITSKITFKKTSEKKVFTDISLTIVLDHPAQKTISIPIEIEINELFKKIDENISEQEAIKNQFKNEQKVLREGESNPRPPPYELNAVQLSHETREEKKKRLKQELVEWVTKHHDQKSAAKKERQKGGGRGKGGSSLSDLRNSGKFIKKSGRMRLKKKLNM